MAKNKLIPAEKKKRTAIERFSVKLVQKPSNNPLKRIVMKFSKIIAKKSSKKSAPSVARQIENQGKRQHSNDFDIIQDSSPPEKKHKPNEETLVKHPKCRRRLFADMSKYELKMKLRKNGENEYFVD